MNFERIFLVVFFTLVMPAAWVFLTPIAKRMNRAAERPGEPSPETTAQFQRLESRIAELEERLDFTERMLATQRDQERLGQGGG